MEETIGNNKIVENNDNEDIEFTYNFLDIPWDDRSNRSKVSIVGLLVAIFIVTMACVINNFTMHYRGYGSAKNLTNELSCHRVRMDTYRYVARIHSVSSKELLCVGAVVSSVSVLANGVCVKSGPIRLHLGSQGDPRCRKGFSVDIIEPVFHDGVVAKKLVLLSSYENMADCTKIIGIGQNLNWNAHVLIIGRPLNIDTFLSRQYVSLAGKEVVKLAAIKNLNKNNLICVKDLARCPVRAGDLLVQKDRLFGVAATSVHRTDQTKIACFADLNMVHHELAELDSDIKMNSSF